MIGECVRMCTTALQRDRFAQSFQIFNICFRTGCADETNSIPSVVVAHRPPFERCFAPITCLIPSFRQAAWAWVVSLPVTLANFSPARAVPMGVGGWVCFGMAAAGLAVETVADYQAWMDRLVCV